jgi:hypothetical protein
MADMEVDIPEPKGKEGSGKDPSKKRFEVKKVCDCEGVTRPRVARDQR